MDLENIRNEYLRINQSMYKVCKIRIYPNKAQIGIITKTLDTCRYVYNLYLEYNQKIYKEKGEFLSAYEFSKILNKLKKNEPRYQWISDVSSKAIKDTIMAAEKAFKRFFKKKGGYPKFRSKKRNPITSFFFIKDNIKFYQNRDDKRNKIKLPILGEIRITEKNYLPYQEDVSSGRIISKGGKYYAMFIYDAFLNSPVVESSGIGVDLGIKQYATIYSEDGITWNYKSFLNHPRYQELDEKIKYFQQLISKKVEYNYGKLLNSYFDKYHKDPSEQTKNIMKGESYNTSQIRKLRKKINRMYEKRSNYARDKILKLIKRLIELNPKYIAIEKLNVSSMLENDSTHKLHDFIAKSKWYFFYERLLQKSRETSVEVRYPKDPYFASSKLCCRCKNKLSSLTLSDRTYHCPKCGLVLDRDLNAAINLCFMDDYLIA